MTQTIVTALRQGSGRMYPAVGWGVLVLALLAMVLLPGRSWAVEDSSDFVTSPTGELGGATSGSGGSERAYFEVGFLGEPNLTFTILLMDAAKIQEARDIISGVQTDAVQVLGTIVKSPVSYNPRWSYHLAPESIQFFEIAVEVCDAHPQYVEQHLDEVCGAFLPGCTWCPYSSVVAAEVTRHTLLLPLTLREA